METTPTLEFPSANGKVYRLKKTLYGLKQSHKTRFERLIMFSRDVAICRVEHMIYCLLSILQKGRYISYLIYRWYCIAEYANWEIILPMCSKDLGSFKYILIIEVVKRRQGIFIFQWKYVLDFLKEIGNAWL